MNNVQVSVALNNTGSYQLLPVASVRIYGISALHYEGRPLRRAPPVHQHEEPLH